MNKTIDKMNMIRTQKLLLTLLGSGLILASASNAQLTITNGDFETGGGENIDNITGWFNYTSGDFWEGSWQTDAPWITPNGTTIAMLGSFDNSGSNNTTASADPLAGSYLYQNIGTADGLDTLLLQFDFGAPNDDPGGRTLGLSVAVYAYDGVGTFSADNSVDIRAAFLGGDSGLSLLDSESFQMVSTGVDGQISTFISALDISDAGSQSLYLNFNNYRPADTESWSALDNVSIVPEPGTYALFAGLAALGFIMVRRRLRKA